MRDSEAEVAIFWRIVHEMRQGTMFLAEALDELYVMQRYTESSTIRARCRAILAQHNFHLYDSEGWLIARFEVAT